MRKLFPLFVVTLMSSAVVLSVRASEEKTITGMAQCAKCALKETKECQNVVVVKDGDKEIKYYMVQNDVAKKAHGGTFCKAKKDDGPKVKVTGDVKEEDGKKVITPTKIEDVD